MSSYRISEVSHVWDGIYFNQADFNWVNPLLQKTKNFYYVSKWNNNAQLQKLPCDIYDCELPRS